MSEDKSKPLGKIEIKKTSASDLERSNSNSDETEQERRDEKKKISNGTIIIGTVTVIVLIGLFITILNSSPDKQEYASFYNGYIFEKTDDGFWQTTIKTTFGDKRIEFYHHPQELENYVWDPDINFYLASVQRVNGNVHIALDPDLLNENYTNPAIAGIEIKRVTDLVFGLKTTSAFTEQVDTNLSVMNCDMANSTDFVIELRDSNSVSEVRSSKYCAMLFADSSDNLIRMADLFNYKTIGIMS